MRGELVGGRVNHERGGSERWTSGPNIAAIEVGDEIVFDIGTAEMDWRKRMRVQI